MKEKIQQIKNINKEELEYKFWQAMGPILGLAVMVGSIVFIHSLATR